MLAAVVVVVMMVAVGTGFQEAEALTPTSLGHCAPTVDQAEGVG